MRMEAIGKGVCDGCGANGVELFACYGAPLSGGAICGNCAGLELDPETMASTDRVLDACNKVEALGLDRVDVELTETGKRAIGVEG